MFRRVLRTSRATRSITTSPTAAPATATATATTTTSTTTAAAAATTATTATATTTTKKNHLSQTCGAQISTTLVPEDV